MALRSQHSANDDDLVHPRRRQPRSCLAGPGPTNKEQMNALVIKTSDLALATALRCHQYEPDHMELRGKQAFWVFVSCDGLVDTKNLYDKGDLLVEPRKYNFTLRRTREQLFAYLQENGIKPKKASRG